MTNAKFDDWFRPIYTDLTRLSSDEVVRWDQGGDEPTEADIERLAEFVLRDAVREGASDIHFEPQSDGVRVRFRVDGVLMDTRLVSHEHGTRLIRHFKALAELDPVATFKPQDARRTVEVEGRDVDVRLASAPCVFGEKLTLRLLDPQRVMHRLDDLGLSGEAETWIKEWITASTGMLLVSGPTGSGKTTTLYALLHVLRLNEQSIVTVEDPVEYRIDGVTQMQVDERHNLTFAAGLRAMLRLDSDYLFLGEIRDSTSAQAALEAATSGRVLMSTLHSRDALNVVTALRNWDVADHEIAATLEVVVSQRLVRKLCPACRERGQTTANERSWLTAMGREIPETVWHARGCAECRGTGYGGRTGVFEVWRLDEEDFDLILNHTDEHTLRERLLGKTILPLLDEALAKVETGVTTFDEVRQIAGLSPSRAPQ